MDSNNDGPFFDTKTTLAFIAVPIALFYFLKKTVFNSNNSLPYRISCGVLMIPTLFLFGFIYLIIPVGILMAFLGPAVGHIIMFLIIFAIVHYVRTHKSSDTN